MLKLWKEHTLQIKTAQSFTSQFKNLVWTHKNWYITLHSVKAKYNFISFHSWNHSGWKGQQKVYSPTSCSHESQLWGTTRLLRALPYYILKPCKNDTAQSLWACPVPLPKCPREKDIGYTPMKGCHFSHFCPWPLSQRLVQSPQFPPCGHCIPVVRSFEALSAPGWISPSSWACHSMTNLTTPTAGLHIRPCWSSWILLFTHTLLDGSSTLKHIEDVSLLMPPSISSSKLVGHWQSHRRGQEGPEQTPAVQTSRESTTTEL